MDKVTKIGERIKVLREISGTTQQALADALHVKRETINMWENGGRDLKTGSICDLADFFGVSADYLLGRTENSTLDTEIQAVCEMTGLTEAAIKILNKANRNKGEKEIPQNVSIKDGKELNTNYHYAFLFLFDRLIRHVSATNLACEFADWVSAFSEYEPQEDFISEFSADRDSTAELKSRIQELTGEPFLTHRIISMNELNDLFAYKCNLTFENIIKHAVIASSNLYPDHPARINNKNSFFRNGE